MANQQPRKRFGAPPKREPKQGEKAATTLRLTADLKRKLDAAAEHNGRSQSQEAEVRLERSFHHEQLLPEALSLKFGRAGAGILLALGFIMEQAGGHYLINEAWRDVPKGAGIEDVDPVRWDRVLSLHWADDPDSRKMGLLATLALLAMLPPRKVTPDELLACLKPAIQVVRFLRSDELPPASGSFRNEIETIRSVISPDMIKRPASSVMKDTARALDDLVGVLATVIAQLKREPTL